MTSTKVCGSDANSGRSERMRLKISDGVSTGGVDWEASAASGDIFWMSSPSAVPYSGNFSQERAELVNALNGKGALIGLNGVFQFDHQPLSPPVQPITVSVSTRANG